MLKITHRRIGILAISLFMLVVVPVGQAGEIAVKDGQTIAFLGDSITASGWINPTGYVKLTVAGLEANGIRVNAIPAGISGNRSDQMSERLKQDVLNKKPDWMILSCGVNDVWHGSKGVPLAQYKINITAIVDRCQATGVKVVILTATVIGEDLDNDFNKQLVDYNEFLRSLAREKKCLLADLSTVFQKRIKASHMPGSVLTTDGVHMNPEGDKAMALGILQAFGLKIKQIKKAQEMWTNIRAGIDLHSVFVGFASHAPEATRAGR
jgi:lysophospholipase L1-like esterase